KVENSETFRFEFALVAEPRLTILGVGEPILSEAMDDLNHSLALQKETDPARLRRRLSMGRRGHYFAGSMHSVDVYLSPPRKEARTLKLIRGNIPVTLEKEKKTTVLTDDFKKAQGKKIILGNDT